MNESSADGASLRLLRADGRPATVLQVLPSLVAGDAERGTLQVAAALKAAGATALVASQGGPLERELSRLGVEHVTLPLASKNPWVMRDNADRMAALLRQQGVDIVHARSRAPAWSARAAARRTGRAFVTTCHMPYGTGNPIKRHYSAVMASGERVIAVSRFIAEHVRQHYRVEDARLRTVPRGIDLALFDPAQVSAERVVALATAWRLPDGVPLIMLPGRLARRSGQNLLLAALEQIADLDFLCVLVGAEGGRKSHRRELEARITAGPLAKKVFIADDCGDMPAAYKLADVVVSASLEPEGFGRVVSEAQAMGRPVVVSAHGSAREQVVADETGFLFAPGNARDLAEALRRALQLDSTARARLYEAAIAWAHQHYDKEAMCRAVLAVYAEVLAARQE